MKILVTGASGFLGQWTMKELARRDHIVLGLDKVQSEGTDAVDITNLPALSDAVSKFKPDVIIHLAAISGTTGKNEVEQSLRQPYLNFLVNSMGTANVCECCRANGVRRLLYMSTFAVYGRTEIDRLPLTETTVTRAEHAYAVSKLQGEDTIRSYSSDFHLESVIFRAPFIVGEGQTERNVVREFVDSAMNNRELILYGNGTHCREFVHPIDIVDAFERALELHIDGGGGSELFVLGNKRISIRDLAHLVILKTGKGRLRLNTSNTDRAFNQYTDYTKAQTILGWNPTLSVGDIVERVIRIEY